MQIRKKQLENSLNKKVKNATKIIYEGISFDSKLEKYFYKYSKEHGFNFKYEQFKTILLEGYRLKGYLYQPNKSGKLSQYTTKIQNMTYSPDFYEFIDIRGIKTLIIVETKGLKTQQYMLKKKMFLKLMDIEYGKNFYFLELHNQKQIEEGILLLKNL